MPKVTKTIEEFGDISTTSYQFESFEDFRQYESSVQGYACGAPSNQTTDLGQPKDGYLVLLTKEEIDKVRILLGNVVGDKVCSNLHESLDELVGNYIECDEYNTVVYQCIDSVTKGVKQWHDGAEEMSIVFKEKE